MPTAPVVYELIEERLGRKLTDGERAIDLVGIDQAFARAKSELHAAIEEEKSRAIAEHLRTGRRPKMQITEKMREILLGLYELGRREAVAEIGRLGLAVGAYAAGDPPEIGRSLDILRDRLGYVDVRIGRESAEIQARGGISGIVQREAERRVPGGLDAAGRVLSPAFSNGLTDVYSTAAGLFSTWVYTAVLDGATCEECEAHDGEEFSSLEEALEVMPDFGPNPDCYGETRCRCRLVPGETSPDAEPIPVEPIEPEPLPPETPLTEALKFPGRSIHADTHAAIVHSRDRLAALVRLPSTSNLPTGGLPVKIKSTPGNRGSLRFRTNGEPVDINVDPVNSAHPAVTFAHEFGHLLDLSYFGPTGKYAMTETTGTTLGRAISELKDAWDESASVQTLHASKRSGVVEADYYLDPRELWARSFAQWASRRDDVGTLAVEQRIAILREQTLLDGLPEHWQDGDFDRIDAAITSVLEAAGVLR